MLEGTPLEGVRERRCTACFEMKPLELFSKRNVNASGYRTWCKPCRAKYSSVTPRGLNSVIEKPCTDCGKTKALCEFSKSARGAQGVRSQCKECCNKKTKARFDKLAGTEFIPGSKKLCNKCGETKAIEAFSVNRHTRDGVRATCRSCCSEIAMLRNDKNPDIRLNAHLVRNYGITLAEYEKLVSVQNGLCAICGDPPVIRAGVKSDRPGRTIRPRLVIDHCHDTGIVRGLLCRKCNSAIGLLRDNPTMMRLAAEYLEKQI